MKFLENAVDALPCKPYNHYMKKSLILFFMMYIVTVIVVGIESGSVLLGMKIGVITATVKTVVAKIHYWYFHSEYQEDEDNYFEDYMI